MWQCPLTQSRHDCREIRGIVPGSSVAPRDDEIRTDQWLGVAVSSQGPGQAFSQQNISFELNIWIKVFVLLEKY